MPIRNTKGQHRLSEIWYFVSTIASSFDQLLYGVRHMLLNCISSWRIYLTNLHTIRTRHYLLFFFSIFCNLYIFSDSYHVTFLITNQEKDLKTNKRIYLFSYRGRQISWKTDWHTNKQPLKRHCAKLTLSLGNASRNRSSLIDNGEIRLGSDR